MPPVELPRVASQQARAQEFSAAGREADAAAVYAEVLRGSPNNFFAIEELATCYIKLGRADVLAKLLPLHDVLRHAHQEVQTGHADSPLAKGMDAIFREFEKIFREEGVTVLDPVGKPFDPHYHEALGVMDKPGFDEDSVAEVLQTGFLLGDKILRTAKVRLQKKTS